MATLPAQFDDPPDNQYITLLEVSRAIAAPQQPHRTVSGSRTAPAHSSQLHISEPDSARSSRGRDATAHSCTPKHAGTIQPGAAFGMTESPSAEVWRTQEPLIIADTAREPHFARAMKMLSENGVISVLQPAFDNRAASSGDLQSRELRANAYGPAAAGAFPIGGVAGRSGCRERAQLRRRAKSHSGR